MHEPNWQTVLQLKKISKHSKNNFQKPKFTFMELCYGKSLSNCTTKEGFIIKGRAENVESIFSQGKVLLAPIPFGAGIKGKLLESIQFGLPNVTSTIKTQSNARKFRLKHHHR